MQLSFVLFAILLSAYDVPVLNHRNDLEQNTPALTHEVYNLSTTVELSFLTL